MRYRKVVDASRGFRRYAAILLAFVGWMAFSSVVAQGGRELIVAYPGDIQSLDPMKTNALPDVVIIPNIFNGLVRFAPTASQITLEPDLAESYEISEDGLVYTFHLRQGVQFHKGYGEFTSEDVKFTLERIRDPESGSLFASALDGVMDRVEIVDRYTVQVVLKEPNPDFLATHLAFRGYQMVSKAGVEDLGDDFARNPVGTGAYAVEQYAPREALHLVAHGDYFRGAPPIERVTVQVVPDEQVAALALIRGEIQGLLALRGAAAYVTLKDRPEVTIEATPGAWFRGFWLNTQQAPLDDVRVRHALSYALDRDALVQDAMEGLGTVGWSVIPDGVFGHDPETPQYPYDPERARELLQEAGYYDNPVVLRAYTRATDASHLQMAAGYWEDIGVNVEVNIVEPGVYATHQRDPEGNYHILTQGLARAAPSQFIDPYFHSSAFPGGLNATYYDKVDELIEAQRSETDPAVRSQLLAQIQQSIGEDQPILIYAYSLTPTATHRCVTGLVPNTHYWVMLFELMEFVC